MRLILGILLFSVYSIACESFADPLLNTFIDLENERVGHYSRDSLLSRPSSVMLSNCGNSEFRRHRYLFFSFGPLVYDLDSTVSRSAPIGDLQENNAYIDNSPFSTERPFSEINEDYQKKIKFFRECVGLVVQHHGNRSIRFPKNQPYCQVERLGEQGVKLEGGYCFLQPDRDSSYSVSYYVKDQCLKMETFREKDLYIGSLQSSLGIFRSTDYKDQPSFLPLDTYFVNFSINPISTIQPGSINYGGKNPTWPTTFGLNEVHLPGVKLLNYTNKNALLQVPLYVDNRCERKCDTDGKLCHGPCDYHQPIAAQFKLYRQKGSDWSFVNSWYGGGVAPANWQGVIQQFDLLHDNGVRIPKFFKTGDKFKLEAVFKNPKFDFDFYMRQMRKMLNDWEIIQQNFQTPQGIASIAKVPQVNPINELPQFETINGISFDGDAFNQVQRALKRLEVLLDTRYWPPFYKEICSDGICMSAGKEYMKLTVGFTVGELKAQVPGLSEMEREYEVKDVWVKRINKFGLNEEINNSVMPEIKWRDF